MANAYFSKMMSYSKKASSSTGIDYRVILAQWYLETGGGTSDVSKYANNHAGIKSSSKGKDGIYGRYAKYNSIDHFTTDYIRVMKLSYYDKVRSAKTMEEQIKELDKSPWAEDKNYGSKLIDVIKKNDLGNISVASGGDGSGLFKGIGDFFKSPLVLGGLALIVVFRGR